jgi:hypothetical protein
MMLSHPTWRCTKREMFSIKRTGGRVDPGDRRVYGIRGRHQ